MKKACRPAFTLVEMLVCIGIVLLLIALLLPALNKALESVRVITCANNLRQLGTATLMYANDNRGNFMRGGKSSTFLTGSYANSLKADNFAAEDMWALYTSYLGGDLGKITITNAGSSNELRASSGIVSYATQLQTFRCPSNPNPPSNGIFWYIFWPASTNDVAVKPANLVAAAKSHSDWIGGNLNTAMWSDRVMYGPAAGGLPVYTNHWDRQGNRQAGGNVCCLDGSVQWFGYKTPWVPSVYSEDFVPDGTSGNSSVACPANAVFMYPDPLVVGNNDDTFPVGGVVVIGTNRVVTSAAVSNPLR